jgi:hypothetical protein
MTLATQAAANSFDPLLEFTLHMAYVTTHLHE